jgi:hypothetical protein
MAIQPPQPNDKQGLIIEAQIRQTQVQKNLETNQKKANNALYRGLALAAGTVILSLGAREFIDIPTANWIATGGGLLLAREFFLMNKYIKVAKQIGMDVEQFGKELLADADQLNVVK